MSRTSSGPASLTGSSLMALLIAAPLAACLERSSDQRASAGPPAQSSAPEPVPPPPAPAPLPASIDLRPRLESLGLTPRPQGSRGTCSIFTTCEAIEFAWAAHTGHVERLSPEFVNWAAGHAIGHPSDGNFFHNAIAGFEQSGVCSESQMPYENAFDAARTPSADALAQASTLRDRCRGAVVARWIIPWEPNRFGVSDEKLEEIKRVLADGYPVAAGSGHSRLLVGYKDDPSAAGGGAFLTEDSALSRFDQVTYEFVRTQVADVFWIQAVPQPDTAAPTPPDQQR